MIHGSCLCRAVAWEIDGALQWMSHCHCSRCRKSHGASFVTYSAANADDFRFVRGSERIGRYESSPGFFRPFCSQCGSVVPGDPWGPLVFVPAGGLDGELGVKPEMHIFVSSKPPWVELNDALPRFDGYPPGFEAPSTLADLPEPTPYAGKPRGSCLCGAVAYVVEGAPLRWWFCHCGRCRKARAAACASNLFTAADGVRFVRGEDQTAAYKIPEAQFFRQVFCRTCGSAVPRVDPARNLTVIPAGTLDDDPGFRPQAHIFVGSKALWDDIHSALPQYPGPPPS